MRGIERIGRRLRVWLDRGSVEREMDDEMRLHLELEAEERVRAGMPPEAARAAALRDFGGVERFKEEARDARGGRALDDLGADVRYALRGLRRSPGFALTAALTLALGIGATSAVFSAVHAVLLAPLPYPAPERLVRVHMQFSPRNRGGISDVDWLAIRDQQRGFESAALYRGGGAAASIGGRAEWVSTGRVTADFFRTLGVTLARGRGFQKGDDAPGAPPVVVVSEGFWRRHFGEGDPVGRTLVLDRVAHTVVGVLPGGEQRHAGLRAEVWPILQPATPTRRGPFGSAAVARLREGVTLDAAARDLAAISVRIFPIWQTSFQGKAARLTPMPLRDAIVGNASRALAVLAAGVALVLLIAIANVANLVLVRALGRAREMAVRTALGAGRSRLARMLLTESLVLGAVGGVGGVAVAVLGLAALNKAGPQLPRLDEAHLDVRVLLFTLGAALASGLLVGLYPLAFGVSRSLGTTMRSGDRRTGATRGARVFQGALVASEFALAVPLLVGAGLLLQSFLRLQRVDPGFDARNLLAAQITLPTTAYGDAAAMERFWEEAQRRVRRIPGVIEVGLTSTLPPDNGGDVNNFDLLDRPVEPGVAEPVAPWAMVTPELFPALGIPLLEGRAFGPRDDADAPPVALVSRTWARRFFPNETAIGKRMYSGGCRECPPTTVVGIVGDVKYLGLANDADAVYQPVRGAGFSSMFLVVRTATAPASLIAAVRESIHSIDPEVPLRDLAPMEDRLSESVADPRRLTWLLGSFAAAAVVLAALGVFGVMSYAVAQQRREIGVRIALGADARTVVAMIVRRGLARALAGLAVGLFLALYGTRLLRAMLFDVSATDPATVVGAPLLLLVVAALACWLPGRRAARIHPAEVIAGE
jgi:predicted permease